MPQVKGRPKVCSFCGQEGHNQRSCYARCEAEVRLWQHTCTQSLQHVTLIGDICKSSYCRVVLSVHCEDRLLAAVDKCRRQCVRLIVLLLVSFAGCGTQVQLLPEGGPLCPGLPGEHDSRPAACSSVCSMNQVYNSSPPVTSQCWQPSCPIWPTAAHGQYC